LGDSSRFSLLFRLGCKCKQFGDLKIAIADYQQPIFLMNPNFAGTHDNLE